MGAADVEARPGCQALLFPGHQHLHFPQEMAYHCYYWNLAISYYGPQLVSLLSVLLTIFHEVQV